MKIAYISTHLPRECGIATFNNNLIKAINANMAQGADQDSMVIAMNESDDKKQYSYGPEVKFVIRQEKQKDYKEAAAYINKSQADFCIVQHEFGIYGGDSGTYVLTLLQELQKPALVIFHTVLREPTYIQKLLTREIAKTAAGIVVMSHKAVRFLTDIYSIDPSKIHLIEHGVPDIEPSETTRVQEANFFEGRKVMFTFGLISRNKGLETVIRALPKIVNKHPDVHYVVLGATHPGVVKHSGEEYRESLKQLATDLEVDKHVHFINKFVSEDELMSYLSSCHIYVTPYLNEAQITSGTLSYAIGAGAAVLSTPYWHAQELLDHNRGRLFNFKDFNTLADTVIELCDDDLKLQKLRNNAYQYGLQLRWPKIGAQYLQTFAKLAERQSQETVKQGKEYPKFSLAHIKRLTDNTGLIQHAKYGIPNLTEGYCLDDNSRALLLSLMHFQKFKNEETAQMFPIYMSYIHYMQREDGYFRNFLSFNRDFLDEKGSEDSFGRTIWALGYLIWAAPNNSYREFGEDLLDKSRPHFSQLKYIRGVANTIIGISYYLKTHPSDERMMQELRSLTAQLLASYTKDPGQKWAWFEDELTYDNAIMPLALLHSAEITGDEKVRHIAFESMNFLESVTFEDGVFKPVGNEEWYAKGRKKSVYDQQAIETMAMALMYHQAYSMTKKPEILHKLKLTFEWFIGNNSLRIPLYDFETQGCCDGLQAGKLNRNQGAESTLAFLISHLAVLKAIDETPKEYRLLDKKHNFKFSRS